MLRKPTQRKMPKKYEGSEKQQTQEYQRAYSKPVMKEPKLQTKANNNIRQPSVRGRVAKVQQKISNAVGKMSNNDMQALLIQEMKGIKKELKEIKQYIGINGSGQKRQEPESYQEQQEQNIYAIQQKIQKNNSAHSNSGGKYPKIQHIYQQKDNKMKQSLAESRFSQQKNKSSAYRLYEKPKQLIDVGKIQPYMKEFKIEVTKNVCPFYNGYHKKSSKPVIIKYCPQNKSIEPLFNLYQKLWKNIVKAKQICINKVYDLNEPLATYILVIEANKYSLSQMLSNKIVSVSQILCSLLKAIQFFHECGYLYRNMHPWHVMYSYDGDIVLIDLKNMRRFVDIKNKHMQVKKDPEEIDDQFVSNSRARGLKQGRKDDLQSLGYLALYMLEGSLPWSLNNLVQVRSKLTIKDLCGRYPALMEFMILIAQMQTEDVPNYSKLGEILANV